MGHTWTNSSWQMMEAIGRQEMAYSKLSLSHYKNGHYTHRSQMGISNFSSRAKTFDHIPCEDCCENSPYNVHKEYHGSHDNSDQTCGSVGGKLFLCYGDSSMSFSSNIFLFYLLVSFKELKLFLDGYVFLKFNLACSTSYSRYISYSCYEVVKFLFYEVMGQRDHSLFVNVPHQVVNLDRNHFLMDKDLCHDFLFFISNDVDPWNICDSLGDANHYTFGFLGNNSYGFDGSLISLLSDHCVEFQGEAVEHLQYVLTSLDPYVIGFVEQNLVEKSLLLVHGLIVKSCQKLKFLMEISFKTLFEKAFGIKFFHLHYKEFLLSKDFENQMILVLKLTILDMTQDEHETVEIFQEPITRAKKIKKSTESLNNDLFAFTVKVLKEELKSMFEGLEDGYKSPKSVYITYLNQEVSNGTSWRRNSHKESKTKPTI
ncbi:hypothetical protein M9H77_18566 [Catharanthus roseus]|uniref:Uncharacterized protein n=1 Tax=Catharanthus roseus TaxID=4058 RepID=A0ACC0B837_CATRO|nr:hypothetical protein M9H77_18566 [Catharanthus roseus]